MTSDTAPNIAPEPETVKPPRKILLGGHANLGAVRLVDAAVLELKLKRPKLKRAHFVVEAAVQAARVVVGDARADAFLKARRKDDVAA